MGKISLEYLVKQRRILKDHENQLMEINNKLDKNYDLLNQIFNKLSDGAETNESYPSNNNLAHLEALELKLPISSNDILNEVEELLQEKDVFNCLVKCSFIINLLSLFLLLTLTKIGKQYMCNVVFICIVYVHGSILNACFLYVSFVFEVYQNTAFSKM